MFGVSSGRGDCAGAQDAQRTKGPEHGREAYGPRDGPTGSDGGQSEKKPENEATEKAPELLIGPEFTYMLLGDPTQLEDFLWSW